MDSFPVWFEENMDSDELRDGYAQHVLEAKHMGEKPKSFRQWAKERYKALNCQGDVQGTHLFNTETGDGYQ